MASGPSKFTALVRQALTASGNAVAILLVAGGDAPSGFEVQALPGVKIKVPDLLREMADEIERTEATKN